MNTVISVKLFIFNFSFTFDFKNYYWKTNS